MADYFNDMLDDIYQFEELEDYLNWEPPLRVPKTCHFCGKSNLHWEQLNGKWKMEII